MSVWLPALKRAPPKSVWEREKRTCRNGTRDPAPALLVLVALAVVVIIVAAAAEGVVVIISGGRAFACSRCCCGHGGASFCFAVAHINRHSAAMRSQSCLGRRIASARSRRTPRHRSKQCCLSALHVLKMPDVQFTNSMKPPLKPFLSHPPSTYR